MHVIDLLDLGVLLNRHRVEAEVAAHHLEARLELREVFERRPGAHVLIAVEHGHANAVLHGDDRLVEVAALPGGRRATLALDREGVDVLTAVSVLRRDQVRADALRHERGVPCELRVGRPGASRRTHRNAAHALHPAADDRDRRRPLSPSPPRCSRPRGPRNKSD